MSDETTPLLSLPFLDVGQAQKETTHNEALMLIDLAVQPVVEAVALDVPPPGPVAGACWIVGSAPSGAWTGHAGALAGWAPGGWRFIPARAGMAAWSRADAALARFDGTGWVIGSLSGTRVVIGGVTVVAARQPAIASPAGGTTIDSEARSAITAALGALRAHGLIAP